MKVIYFAIISFIFASGMQCAYADEPILITLSGGMNKVIFDGKWSFFEEWKPTSLNTFSYNDGTIIEFRSAHQGNFIYMFVDAISSSHFAKGSDYAMICFDRNDNKTVVPDADDYCFMSVLDGNSFAYQGNSPLGFNGNFKKIPNPDGFIGIGGISDKNDRYTDISHPGYEFRIPTDTVGRSSDYGFFFVMYDTHFNKFYSWPQNVTIDSPFKIPSPSVWGDLISPDQSLPEFPWPVIVLISSFTAVLFFSTKRLGFHNK